MVLANPTYTALTLIGPACTMCLLRKCGPTGLRRCSHLPSYLDRPCYASSIPARALEEQHYNRGLRLCSHLPS